MPNTGERGEITSRANVKEAEMVQESKKLVSQTRQLSEKMDAKNRQREAATQEKPSGKKKKR